MSLFSPAAFKILSWPFAFYVYEVSKSIFEFILLGVHLASWIFFLKLGEFLMSVNLVPGKLQDPGAEAQGPASLPGHVAPVAQSRTSDKDTG